MTRATWLWGNLRAASIAGKGRPCERCGLTERAKASDCRRARASTNSRSRETPRDHTDKKTRMTITTRPVGLTLTFPARPKSSMEPFTECSFPRPEAADLASGRPASVGPASSSGSAPFSCFREDEPRFGSRGERVSPIDKAVVLHSLLLSCEQQRLD